MTPLERHASRQSPAAGPHGRQALPAPPKAASSLRRLKKGSELDLMREYRFINTFIPAVVFSSLLFRSHRH